MARREIRVERDRLAEEILGNLVVLAAIFVEMPHAALVGLPGIETVGPLAQDTLLFGGKKGRLDDTSDRSGDLVLHREDIEEVAIVPFGPNMCAGDRVDQLRGHSDPIAAAPY